MIVTTIAGIVAAFACGYHLCRALNPRGARPHCAHGLYTYSSSSDRCGALASKFCVDDLCAQHCGHLHGGACWKSAIPTIDGGGSR